MLPQTSVRFLVTAEHAVNTVPEDISLGVDAMVLNSHVAWDPGAKEYAEKLASILHAPLRLGEQTRLVADLNRSSNNPDAVPEIAFGVLVPGNKDLDPKTRQERIARYHEPFWNWMHTQVQQANASGQHVYHLSVHTFTPVYEGKRRAIDLGFLYDPAFAFEHSWAKDLEQQLSGDGSFPVGHNQPYDGREDSIVTHFRTTYSKDQYTSLQLELNQARIDDEAFSHWVINGFSNWHASGAYPR